MNGENKPNNKDFQKDKENQISIWSRIGVQAYDDLFLNTIIKSERICAGIYLVTTPISSDDPIKWELRTSAIELQSSADLLSDINPSVRTDGLIRFANSSTKILSLLRVSRLSGQLSVSNVDILINEIEKIGVVLSNGIEKSVKSAGYVLSESFFNELRVRPDDKGQIKDISQTVDKSAGALGDGVDANKSAGGTHTSNIGISSSGGSATLHKPKKNDREEAIMNILKKGGSLSIKDFTLVIKDCSEKTIQRELTSMVERGLIQKEGERRWSRYFL